MEKKGKIQDIALIILLVAVITLSIAYAVLSTTLTLSAQATVKASTNWNVQFVDVSGANDICIASGNAQVKTQPTITSTAFTGLAVDFKTPGDKVVCKWNVENNGSVAASLKTFTKPSTYSYSGASGDVSKVDGKISYTLTYSDDTAITAGDSTTGNSLPADATTGKKGLKLVIEYSSSATDLPAADVVVTGFDTTFLYEQK